MATMTAVWVLDYANTITVTNNEGTLAASVVSGPITLGKNRIFKVMGKDTTTPASSAQIAFTMGLSTGTVAPSPTAASPFFSLTQDLTFDTGALYDQINLGNFHNGADSIDYSIVILSKY
jgi:hypothetical protein